MPELAIIFSGIVVLTLISFVFGNAIHKRQMEYKERQDAIERAERGADPGGANAKITKLEERVRVLERLATDRGTTLADQIDALRDERGDNGVPLPISAEKEHS